ncbi:DUF1835 domain-containing protein [Methylocystis sp. MJC1]|uniref:DUF3658 domain-containing protein n=1 Tax=Methylocystis sp. MJC1 TaxID=2654282 RepID=UPI0013EA5292|nr:DUF3658 domain-containing protein [Methylocystis sp. MJC1]KAF2989343.1 hypothetical protein MJC1_03493 [Methylocystis sp. MJC1]MBU6526906.1 DUF1835 domain-containing protein [Methylocystis sp. MJC1]UZX13342.1 DUF1835 domain-containing protein [Methylocystis sp. MJC1]
MAETIVHILPSLSAAGTAKQALEELGVNEKLVVIGDHLGYGPINGGRDARRQWLEDNLGEHYGERVDMAELAWREALAPEAYPIIWTCRSDAGDHAAFLEFLSRVGERAFGLIDATDAMIQGRAGLWRVDALGVISKAELISAGLLRRRTEMSRAEIAEGREIWHRLRSENAPLRVTENDRLVSKPISFFDAELLEEAPQDWERAVRIVGAALARFCASHRLVSDSFIWSRYLALAEDGLLDMKEIEGAGDGMRGFLMRAPVQAD